MYVLLDRLTAKSNRLALFHGFLYAEYGTQYSARVNWLCFFQFHFSYRLAVRCAWHNIIDVVEGLALFSRWSRRDCTIDFSPCCSSSRLGRANWVCLFILLQAGLRINMNKYKKHMFFESFSTFSYFSPFLS